MHYIKRCTKTHLTSSCFKIIYGSLQFAAQMKYWYESQEWVLVWASEMNYTYILQCNDSLYLILMLIKHGHYSWQLFLWWWGEWVDHWLSAKLARMHNELVYSSVLYAYILCFIFMLIRILILVYLLICFSSVLIVLPRVSSRSIILFSWAY